MDADETEYVVETDAGGGRTVVRGSLSVPDKTEDELEGTATVSEIEGRELVTVADDRTTVLESADDAE
jgi:hypothetical protein